MVLCMSDIRCVWPAWSDVDSTWRLWILSLAHTYFGVVAKCSTKTQPRPACILNIAGETSCQSKISRFLSHSAWFSLLIQRWELTNSTLPAAVFPFGEGPEVANFNPRGSMFPNCVLFLALAVEYSFLWVEQIGLTMIADKDWAGFQTYSYSEGGCVEVAWEHDKKLGVQWQDHAQVNMMKIAILLSILQCFISKAVHICAFPFPPFIWLFVESDCVWLAIVA